MSRMPVPPASSNDFVLLDDQIDCAYLIDQDKLNLAKIYSSREEYVKTLPFGLNYMEVGVAWGYYSELVAKQKTPECIHLVDYFDKVLVLEKIWRV